MTDEEMERVLRFYGQWHGSAPKPAAPAFEKKR